MPPPVKRRQAPGYNASVDTTAPSNDYSTYKLFKPEFSNQIEFVKPSYDKRTKPTTVFRPYPCRAYDDDNPGFEPYRIDPGGKNYPGHWYTRLHVADRIGSPATTFILNNPFTEQFFDLRTSPLSVLVRAVGSAIKKGQGKAESWRKALQPAFDPTAAELLKWTGMREGGDGEKAALTAPSELFLMQGVVMMLGGKNTATPDKTPPGWGEGAKTCVFGLTVGAGKKFLDLINEENENYRGDPGDFERRYVNGDPVGVDTGRFLYVYPCGGDPRQSRQQSVPTGYDPLASTRAAGVSGKAKEEEEKIGFDMHFDKTFQGRSAALNKPDQVHMIRGLWKYWEDILWFPTIKEQVSLLATSLPASMLEYAFTGEHDDWLTEDVRLKASMSRSASVPNAPELPRRGPVPTAAAVAAANPFGESPPGWNQAAAPDPFPQGSTPFDNDRPDEALRKPDATPTIDPAAVPAATGSIDDLLASAASQAAGMFGDVPEQATTYDKPAQATVADGPAAAWQAAAAKKSKQPAS